MSDKLSNMNITDTIKDKEIREYFYLDLSIEELCDTMCALELHDIGDDENTPFWAQIRGYTSARDREEHSWLVKEIPASEGPAHKIQEIAYYVDFLLKTPAAPTVLLLQDNKVYRATKQVVNAMQIGSYNYLQEPYIKMLANDLLNRWLFFDEDRNPNNYMVKHDSDGEPFIVVIDYNKADLETPGMKISGTEHQFGWKREEKTRFLTLLRPENFETLSIDDFEQRLGLMKSIEKGQLQDLCRRVFACGIIHDPEAEAKRISSNLIERIDYLDNYFRTWFKAPNKQKEQEENDRYSGLGQSFLDYYKRKT